LVDAHPNGHDDTDVDIEMATDHCVFRANAHCYICSANADPDADTRPRQSPWTTQDIGDTA
jgi:hypothetical protein